MMNQKINTNCKKETLLTGQPELSLFRKYLQMVWYLKRKTPFTI